MKLWTFIFASAEAMLQSARVAAPDRAKACILMAGMTGLEMKTASGESPAPGVILQSSGLVEESEPRIISVVTRDGRLIEAAA